MRVCVSVCVCDAIPQGLHHNIDFKQVLNISSNLFVVILQTQLSQCYKVGIVEKGGN